MAKQKVLPGMEDREHKRLTNLADKLEKIRDERRVLKNKEFDVSGQIAAEMHKLGKSAYRYNGLMIEVVEGAERVKIKTIKEDTDGKDNAEE